MEDDRTLPTFAQIIARRSSRPQRPNLLFVRLSSPSVFESWYRPRHSRSWDLMVSYYGPTITTATFDPDFHTIGGLSKFFAVKALIDSEPGVFSDYQYLMFIDDDLLFHFADIDHFFATAGRFNLSLAQPALTEDSFYSNKITVREKGGGLRYTNFVEVMMPLFSQAAFRICSSTFDKSISSWGLDEVWPYLVGDTHHNIAIVDAYAARHTRPIDLVNGPFYRYLANLGVEPRAERKSVWQFYSFWPPNHQVHARVSRSGLDLAPPKQLAADMPDSASPWGRKKTDAPESCRAIQSNRSPRKTVSTSKREASNGSGPHRLAKAPGSHRGSAGSTSSFGRGRVPSHKRLTLAEEQLGRARSLVTLGRIDEAAVYYSDCLNYDPGNVTALRELWQIRLRLKDFDGALESVDRLELLGVDVAWELSRVALAFMHVCNWSFRSALRDRLSIRFMTGGPCIVDAFAVLAMTDDPVEHLAMARCISAAISAHINGLPRPKSGGIGATGTRRLRIGYLCGNFNLHPMSLLMAGVLENHDRSRFEVTAYDYSPEDGTPIRARIVSAFEHFVRLGPDGPAKCAARIAAEETDILIDLTGYTEGTRSEIMAFRPSPVQVNFLGYAGTQGAEWIDYVIADRHVLPYSERRNWCERIIYMPHSYYPNDRSRPIPRPPRATGRAEHKLPQEGFIFACFNNTFKISPDVFSLWMQLLGDISGSVLWLYEGNDLAVRYLRSEAMRHAIAADRLIFAPPLPLAAHIDRHMYADLFLDTTPYGAHTTGADALWAGLPIITLPGRSFASRVGSSMLHAVGLPELVSKTSDEYVTLATSLANDRVRLSAIRNHIVHSRATSPLFDAERFARNLERAFFAMAATSREGSDRRDIFLY
jgi:predicted O-linked N-acetylglucosamine transferase (SPINDLY family)